MLDDVLVQSIKRAVNQQFDEQIDLLSKLVAIRSENPDSMADPDLKMPVEKELAMFLRDQLKEMGLSPMLVAATKERPNVVCRVGPSRTRKSLLWHAAMDTNAAEGDYQGDPYQQFVRGERVYGWGVWNMKASISAYIFALKALAQLGYKLRGRLLLTFVADGVSGLGSKIGTRYLLNKGYKAKVAVLGSPGPSIGIGHRGGYRFKLTVKGEAVHTGSMAWQRREQGKNAIEGMAQAIMALRKVEMPFKTAKAFPGRKPVFTFPTSIEGGCGVNRVPDKCVACGDVRLMPGNSHRQVRVRIEEKLDAIEGLEYELEDVLHVPACEVDVKEEIVENMVTAFEAVGGEKPVVEGIGPWNNGWVFVQRDIPVVVQLPLTGGVSRWGLEWISAASLKRLTGSLALSAALYLGIRK